MISEAKAELLYAAASLPFTFEAPIYPLGDHPTLPETYGYALTLPSPTRHLTKHLFSSRFFRLENQHLRRTLTKILYRDYEHEGDYMESLLLSIAGTSGRIFEFLGFSHLQKNALRDHEVIISSSVTEKMYNHPALLKRLNDPHKAVHHTQRAVPDNLVIKVAPDTSTISGVCEVTLQTCWESELPEDLIDIDGEQEAEETSHKLKQLKHYESGQVIHDLLDGDSGWQQLLSDTFNHYYPNYPPQLSFNTDDYRIIFAFPEANGHWSTLPVEPSDQINVYRVPITSSMVFDLTSTIHRDLIHQIRREKEGATFSLFMPISLFAREECPQPQIPTF